MVYNSVYHYKLIGESFMKRILHISKYYYPFIGGVEQIARDCVLSLKGGAEQKIICFDHHSKSKDSNDIVDGVDVIRVGQQALIASQAIGFTYKENLKELFEKFKPDIVIFHYPNPYVSHYLLKLLPANVKLVVYWHLDIYKQKLLKKFFTHQNRVLLKRADVIIATSPNYIEGSPWLSSVKEKCISIPNCIDENRLETTKSEENMAKEIKQKYKDKIICLAVGRHVPYKGFEYLIKAAKLLDDRFIFLITGKGPLTEELHKLADDDPKIEFLGLVSDEELKANLIACDIYTFSSITKNEAFGVALAEGMYFGHPAITFTIPGSGVNYVNLNGQTGIEVPNCDVVSYAKAIEKLANDPDLIKKYGKAARQRVIDNFMFRTYQQNIRDLINTL